MREYDQLLKLARAAIETAFTKKRLDTTAYEQAFSEQRGVFVTLTKEGELRGCIGFLTGAMPLWKGVVTAARAAAFDDPRFPALDPEELGSIRIEVSVLTEPTLLTVKTPAEYVKKINVGRDGLIIKHGFHQGLLLPQVAVEYGWNAETFLEHLCLKAGLPRDAWREPKTRIETFHAEIVDEP